MDNKFLLCSECFKDEGLRLDSYKLGIVSDKACLRCNSIEGKKINKATVYSLAHRFFVRGTLQKELFGAAPLIQFNENNMGDTFDVTNDLQFDIELIKETIGIRFFYYGPRFWMLGDIEPLKSLQNESERKTVIDRVISEYPTRIFSSSEVFYRLRKNPEIPESNSEYDSSPDNFCGTGRLDSLDQPILYGSQDLEVCIHECRVTVEDDLYIASLSPTVDLKLLDLTELLEEDCTEFESLDLAIHMLFYAGNHSYNIAREIARNAKKAGFDGIIYPSYFSAMRTGTMPFDTVYGISIRKIPSYTEYAKSQIIPNIALFDRPIKDGKVSVKCINKLFLNKVQYDIHFGPVKC